MFAQLRRTLVVSWAITALAGTSVHSADIVNLGVLSGQTGSIARGVSENGVVTGDSDAGVEAFRWSGGVMTGLGLLPNGTYSSAYGISADGSKVAGTADSDSGTLMRAFLWNGTYQVIAPLTGGTYSTGYGISADGEFVVGESDSTEGSQAFRWSSGGGIQGLGVLAGESSSTALGTSANGAVVVGVSGPFAFRWESGVMSSLGLLSGGSSSAALGTSSDGSVVVGYADNASAETRAFRWESGVMTDLGTLTGHTNSTARAVSPDGYVVVGFSDSDAFVWRSGHGMQNLRDVLISEGVSGIGDWSSLAEALSVTGNAVDGYSIAGWGYSGSDMRGFLISNLFAVPEPSTYALAVTAGLVLFLTTRKSSPRRATT